MNSLLKIIGSNLVLGLVLACTTLEGPEILSLGQSDVVAKVAINADFVMVKKGDTVQLNFLAVAVNDSIVQVNPDSVRWLSQEPNQVEINQAGRLIGKITNNVPIRVILSYKHNLNTVSDSVLVYVTNEKYEDATIKLVQIDSNIVGVNASFVTGISVPRIRVDVYKDDMLVVKGAQIPVSAKNPVQVQFDPVGGPDREPVYLISNDYGYIGQFWVKSSLNLYGSIVSDSVSFIGQYPAFFGGFGLAVTTDVNGMIIPKNLSPLELEPQMQPCGVFAILNFTSKTLDVVFSDSAESVGSCDDLPAVLPGVSAFGGNILDIPPFGRGNRRVNKSGIVSYYVRDAITKERLPFSGRYEVITIKK